MGVQEQKVQLEKLPVKTNSTRDRSLSYIKDFTKLYKTKLQTTTAELYGYPWWQVMTGDAPYKTPAGSIAMLSSRLIQRKGFNRLTEQKMNKIYLLYSKNIDCKKNILQVCHMDSTGYPVLVRNWLYQLELGGRTASPSRKNYTKQHHELCITIQFCSITIIARIDGYFGSQLHLWKTTVQIEISRPITSWRYMRQTMNYRLVSTESNVGPYAYGWETHAFESKDVRVGDSIYYTLNRHSITHIESKY